FLQGQLEPLGGRAQDDAALSAGVEHHADLLAVDRAVDHDVVAHDPDRPVDDLQEPALGGLRKRAGSEQRCGKAGGEERSQHEATPPRNQYLTEQPYGVVLATVTGFPLIASVSAA